jgi:hypothetical protein
MNDIVKSWLACGFTDIAMQYYLNLAAQENLAFSSYESRLIFLREYDAQLKG